MNGKMLGGVVQTLLAAMARGVSRLRSTGRAARVALVVAVAGVGLTACDATEMSRSIGMGTHSSKIADKTYKIVARTVDFTEDDVRELDRRLLRYAGELTLEHKHDFFSVEMRTLRAIRVETRIGYSSRPIVSAPYPELTYVVDFQKSPETTPGTVPVFDARKAAAGQPAAAARVR